MIGLLWRVLVGRLKSCAHRWETFSEIKVYSDGRWRPVAREYHQRCVNCGSLKRRTFGS